MVCQYSQMWNPAFFIANIHMSAANSKLCWFWLCLLQSLTLASCVLLTWWKQCISLLPEHQMGLCTAWLPFSAAAHQPTGSPLLAAGLCNGPWGGLGREYCAQLPWPDGHCGEGGIWGGGEAGGEDLDWVFPGTLYRWSRPAPVMNVLVCKCQGCREAF